MFNLSVGSAVLCLGLLALSPISGFADDPLPVDESVVEKQPVVPVDEAPVSEDAPVDESGKTSPSKEPTKPGDSAETTADPLQQELEQAANGGQASGAELARQFEALVGQMKSIRDGLELRDRSPQAKLKHEAVVSELDRLIRELEKPPQSQSSPPPQSGENNKPNPGGQGTAPKGAGEQPQQQPTGSKTQQGKGGGQSTTQQGGTGAAQGQAQKPTGNAADQARDSDDGVKSQAKPKSEDPLRDRLAKDIWGHLPPQLREELLNVYSEKYLPKYEDLVRKYYEALADESQR